METKNLQKITDVCQKFHDCFGDTLEGRGYLTVLDMLERAGLTKPDNEPKPQTLQELFKTYLQTLEKAGILDTYPRINIEVGRGETEFKAYVGDMGNVKGHTVNGFLRALEELIAEKGEEYLKKQQKKRAKNNDDVTLK